MSLAGWRTLSVCCKIYVNGTNSHDDFCAEADSVCVYRVDLGYTNLYHFKTFFLSTKKVISDQVFQSIGLCLALYFRVQVKFSMFFPNLSG